MSSYNTFASVYDALTENVEYEARSEYISGFFASNDISPNATVLDLACGTGTLTKLMAEKGYSMTGIDLSEEMLTLAKEKCPATEFYCHSITDLNLPDCYDAAYCSLDSINHLENINEVAECFKSVANNLRKGAIFVFDVNTIYKHQFVLAENTFVFDEEDFYLVWDNEDVDERTVRIFIDVFYYNGHNYDRMSESFTEKAYEINEIKDVLSDFEVIGVYDDMSIEQPKQDSERVYFVCKRK